METISNKQSGKDRANVRFPPPVVYLIATIGGIIIEKFVFSLAVDWAFTVRLIISLGFMVAGLMVIGLSFIDFKRTGQRPEPWTSTPEIISGGIYRFTRNPMYVGMGLIQIAITLGYGTLWGIILLGPSLWFVYLIAIRHEEMYLSEKFGEGYLQYKRSVRRWL